VLHPVSSASNRPGSRERGQATTEFALVATMLFFLMMAIVDFGHMIALHSAAVTASREGARYGSAVGDNGSGTPRFVDCAGIRKAANNVIGGLVKLTDDQISISYDDGLGTAVTEACAPDGTGPDEFEIERLDRVVVEVTLTYAPISPIRMFMGPVTVVSIDRRAIVTQQ
jgi:Flp pilus assembly protein TadG